MNSTLVAPTRPVTNPRAVADRAATVAAPSVDDSVAAAEQRRWVLLLGIPFVIAAVFFALTIGTGVLWLLAPAMVLGPGLLILAFVYLGLTSDTNGTE